MGTTPNTTTLTDRLNQTTQHQWHTQDTGGGHMAVTTTYPNGTEVIITNEQLSENFAHYEPATITFTTEQNPEGISYTYERLSKLFTELLNTDTATKGWCDKCQIVHDWYWCHTN